MSLHIILGLADTKRTTEPTVVYAGRDGEAARQAMAKSTSPRFLVFTNPLGVPKHNPRALINAVIPAAVAAEDTAPAKPRRPGTAK